MKPTESILYWKPGRYRDSAHSDIRETFRRVREELRKAHKRDASKPPNVQPLVARKAAK